MRGLIFRGQERLYRDPSQNPLGLLRRAIEENWPEPPTARAKRKASDRLQEEEDRRLSELNEAKTQAEPTELPAQRNALRFSLLKETGIICQHSPAGAAHKLNPDPFIDLNLIHFEFSVER